jgi:protein involved in polysaccharide export with SLBB domain
MKNKFVFCVVLIFRVFGASVFAQDDTRSRQTTGNAQPPSPSISIADVSQNIMLARSSADYRVTPGDVYTLTYAAGTIPVSYIIVVDSSYRIRVSNLGVVNGAGKTFMQLKSEVETAVANNYPLSGVQLVLTQPAVFRVYVNGEVTTAEEVPAWGLSRLSTLVGKRLSDYPPSAGRNISDNASLTGRNTSGNASLTGRNTSGNSSSAGKSSSENVTSSVISLTDYSSIRDISIKSANGQTRVYDLFKAQRYGDISQDPYLRPGDVVTFNRIKRVVTVDGAVERPGTYQLLDGENIKELIEVYGRGFTPIADKTRLEMVRLINSKEVAGEKIFLTEGDLANNYTLEHYDEITVPVITQLQPVMFIEGAIRADTDTGIITNTETTEELVPTTRITVQFSSGDTYASLVRKNTYWFTPVSDTQNAYILRKNERIPINLNPLLYDSLYRDDFLLQTNDVLIVPFRQYFVTVAGSVAIPGRYPYIPDRDWEYYVGLAGGFIAERNSFKTVNITDMNGKKRKKTDAILPETTITASTNNFLYYFNLYSPVILTAMSIVSTFLSLQAIMNR